MALAMLRAAVPPAKQLADPARDGGPGLGLSGAA